MRSLVSILLLFCSLPNVTSADSEPLEAQASKAEGSTATKAFEAVKKNLVDEEFSDSAAMLKTMKEGFGEMAVLLNLCDANLVSNDEVSRSAAFLCVVAINAHRQTGQLKDWVEDKQIDVVKDYKWQNGPELYRLADDFGYQRKRIPSYRAHTALIVANEQR